MSAECINNEPSDRKIFIRLVFSDGGVSESVRDYDDFAFHNFNTLNFIPESNPEYIKQKLINELNDAVKHERYEQACRLRDAIGVLGTKK